MQLIRETAIAAAPESVFAWVIDFEAYPTWIGELSQVRIVARAAEYVDVALATRVQVRDAVWQLRFTIPDKPGTVAWHLLDSNLLAAAEGHWRVEPTGNQTVLHYRADIALHLPVSRGVRNRVENIFTGPALKRGLGLLKRRLEQTES